MCLGRCTSLDEFSPLPFRIPCVRSSSSNLGPQVSKEDYNKDVATPENIDLFFRVC